MAEERTSRSLEDREVEKRSSDAWVPPSTLPNPDPRPGWDHRWIRTATLGNEDNTNVSQKFREGWVPVKKEDYPEIQVMSDVNSRFEGNIEIGGLLLCKAPTEEMDKRKQYYESAAAQQMESVDNSFMKETDPRMPLLKPERSSRTTFGRG